MTAQEPETPARKVEGQQDRQGTGFDKKYGSLAVIPKGDLTYYICEGYFVFESERIRVRGDKAVAVVDTDDYYAAPPGKGSSDRVPRRGLIAPARATSAPGSRFTARMEQIAIDLSGKWREGQGGTSLDPRIARSLRSLRVSGNVFFESDGMRSLRCESLYLSVVSDRIVMNNVTLRMPMGTADAPVRTAFVLKCPRAVQQGDRLVAYDAVVSTCDAGEPHFFLHSDRLTVLRHKGFVEYFGEGNTLELGDMPALPLPNYRHYSDQENWLPIRGAHAGNSVDLGVFAGIEWGGRWNDVGQGIVDWFADTDKRFRGEWRLETTYTKRRGFPLEPGLKYELPGVFDGWMDGFYVANDTGGDRRSVTQNVDGSPIDATERGFVRTRNRILLGEQSRLDLEAFWGSDPAVYSEYRPNDLKERESPETSAYYRVADHNLLGTVLARTSLPGFQYDETGRLAESFTSQRPEGTLALFSQPLFDLAEAWPVVLDVDSRVGVLNNEYDDKSLVAADEQATRADLKVELRAPHVFGHYALTPFVSARHTYYSDVPGLARDEGRDSFEAGALLSTRFAREFEVNSEFFGVQGLIHEIIPEIRFVDRFYVTGTPSDYFQFDEIDAIDEDTFVDFVFLNRLIAPNRSAASREFLWLDLSQRVYTNPARDNGGERLGLFAFEAILKPGDERFVIPGLRLLFEGERDWNLNDYRTRNIGIAIGPIANVQAAAEWRTGRDGDGKGSLNIASEVWQRWTASFGLIYDFEIDRTQSTNFYLTRRDHDWTWMIGLSRDENTGDETVQFLFTPTFQGLLKPAKVRYVGGDPAFGVRQDRY